MHYPYLGSHITMDSCIDKLVLTMISFQRSKQNKVITYRKTGPEKEIYTPRNCILEVKGAT